MLFTVCSLFYQTQLSLAETYVGTSMLYVLWGSKNITVYFFGIESLIVNYLSQIGFVLPDTDAVVFFPARYSSIVQTLKSPCSG